MTLSALGIFSAAGGGIAPPPIPDYELISTTILGSTSSTIDFTGLGTYSSTYKHLQVRAVHRSSSTSGDAEIGMRFNTDSGTNYNWHFMGSIRGGTDNFGDPNFAHMLMYNSQINGSTNQFQASIIDILDPYNTTKNTTIRTLTGNMGTTLDFQRKAAVFSGAWRNTASITQFSLVNLGGQLFPIGSRFSIYGIK
jgi:hypothetical protein